jgi:hypothetical protein
VRSGRCRIVSITSYPAASPRGRIEEDAFDCGRKNRSLRNASLTRKRVTFGQFVSPPPPCSTGASRLKGIGVMTTRAPTPTVS